MSFFPGRRAPTLGDVNSDPFGPGGYCELVTADKMQVCGIVSNGGSVAQGQAIKRISDANGGNVPPQYASLVLHWDGSTGPASDAVIPPGDPSNYWPGIFAANRYLVLLRANNTPITTVGAIAPAAAQAIMDTYVPVAGDTSGRAVSTAATAAAEAAAQSGTVAAKASAPVATTSQAPAQPEGAPVHTATPVYLPYGTPVTLSNGQQGYADGHGGVIAGAPPASTPASTGPLAAKPLDPTKVPLMIDPGFPVQIFDPATQPEPVDGNGNPVLPAQAAGLGFTLSPAVLLGGAALAFLLFRRRRT